MQKIIALSIVFLFGIWLGQPAMSSVFDINQKAPAVETAGVPDVPLEDTSSGQQQTFDEEEEEKKIFHSDGSYSNSPYVYQYHLNHLNIESDVLIDVLLPPPELV